jgi:glutamate N-acetyltransferase/amino-acid N-acetyltransferase
VSVTPFSVTPIEGGVTAAAGFVAGAVTAGLRTRPDPDLAVVTTSGEAAAAAAVFTTNRFTAAPVLVAREVLAESAGRVRALVINAGCANAGTGRAGIDDARRVTAAVARAIGCDPGEVLPASTGLIGSRLQVDRIEAVVTQLRLRADAAAGLAAATAIMTTDTRPKQAAARLELAGGRTLTVGGMAKGAGMIHPRMATMLALLTTDAQATPALLGERLRTAVDRSFNQISVDGDTSTNDAVFLLASGAAEGGPIQPGSEEEAALGDGVAAVCRSLAQQIAADGEGARTRIDVVVDGAASDEEARLLAKAVATSNLVKAAVHGGDPNWGRIASAAGQCGARLDSARLAIRIGDQLVYDGEPQPFDEARTSRALLAEVVELGLDLRLGGGCGEAWGCDLSAAYVAINSEYRT